jgi:hypothetical protein
MEKSYTYFKNLLNESLDSINQLKLKSQLIEEFKNIIDAKTETLQRQISELKKTFFLNTEETIIDKLNHIKQLQILLGEKDEIIKTLQNINSELSRNSSSGRNRNMDTNDDLPF